MKQSECLTYVIMAGVSAIVHFVLGASAHESVAYAFRFIAICTILSAAWDVIERLRR